MIKKETLEFVTQHELNQKYLHLEDTPDKRSMVCQIAQDFAEHATEMPKEITPFKLKDASKTEAKIPVSSMFPTDEEIATQIYKHLDSLPYAGGYPSDYRETLTAHLGKWFRNGVGNVKT